MKVEVYDWFEQERKVPEKIKEIEERIKGKIEEIFDESGTFVSPEN